MILASILFAQATAAAPPAPVTEPASEASMTAAPAPERYPSLTISFVGGEVAQDLARVIVALADAKAPARPGYYGALPLETVAVGKGEGLCAVFAKQTIPTDCSQIAPLILRLNPVLKRNPTIHAGQLLHVPRVQLAVKRSRRTYDAEDRQEPAWKALLSSWKTKKAIVREIDDRVIVEFNSHDVTFDFGTDEQVHGAALAVGGLRSRNVLIHAPDTIAVKASAAFAFPREYQPLCKDTPANQRYADLLEIDEGLEQFLAAQPQAQPKVYIVDTPIIRTPALAGVLTGHADPPPASWICKWGTFVKARHHGTHMAGIVAGRNKMGFDGLARTARITAIHWHEADGSLPKLIATTGRAEKLSDYINNDQGNANTLSVFLFASSMDPYADIALQDGQIKNLDARKWYPAIQDIFDVRPLFIVAAGQPDDGGQPRRITKYVPMPPQNLGDLENVLVVTACDDCGHKSPTLLASANFGMPPDPIVHVAAPGGQAIPGWIDSQNVGGAAGTSQSAAFAAGVAAEMIARYPNAYRSAGLVKTRLQITAWPMLPSTPLESDSANTIATGIIDYQRALLDPSKDWMKMSQGSWQHDTAIKSLPTLTVIDSQNASLTVNGRDIGRIVKISSEGASPTFAIYEIGRGVRRGIVKRLGRAKLADLQASIELCGGSKIKIVNIEDLIVASSRNPDASAC
ncbi:S8 family serine peptidase [Sphingobium yanoikuyae]|jgi:hypothetical protein|uniref:S8 family serine peptidase n=1 Tax=Sphingobium yanoikuyae TaxID=13690 RepID=UPI00241FBC6A|nr:S8 family serine peptidase [Sphingobium yanoikuyae]HEV7437075.1 S8 family serine peptidase [Pseudorhizobium sp.]